MMDTFFRRALALLFLVAVLTNGLAGQFFVLCFVENGSAHLGVRYDNCCLNLPISDNVIRAGNTNQPGQSDGHGECSHLEVSKVFTRQGVDSRSGLLKALHNAQISPGTSSFHQSVEVFAKAWGIDFPSESESLQRGTVFSASLVLRC